MQCDGNRPPCTKCFESGLECTYFTFKFSKAARPSSPPPPLPVDSTPSEGVIRNSARRTEISAGNESGNLRDAVQEATLRHGQPAVATVEEGQESSAALGPGSLRQQHSLQSRCSDGRPFCHIMICMGLMTFLGSFSLALWWSFTRNDVSGGFTMAAYMVAVGGLPLASIQMRHNQKCRCWDGTWIDTAS